MIVPEGFGYESMPEDAGAIDIDIEIEDDIKIDVELEEDINIEIDTDDIGIDIDCGA